MSYIYCNTVIDRESNEPLALPFRAKADFLVAHGGAKNLHAKFPERFADVSGDCVLIVVVQNASFDAAAIIATDYDFLSMKERDWNGDNRHKRLLLIDKKSLLKEELEALE